MSTIRIRTAIRELLTNQQRANTVEIFDAINERFRWGATMSQITNVLSKDKHFRKVGEVRGNWRVGRYSVCLWELSQNPVKVEPLLEATAR